jgi:outer membrane protein OmpA-like peptidoglycan-associated protein
MKAPVILPIIFILTLLSVSSLAQVKTVSADINWSAQEALVKNSSEADFIIRMGDVDNLGFGWPAGFDPFCGRMTETHNFPWDSNPADLPGFDRILLSSKYNPASPKGCNGDGYSGSWDKVKSKPVTWNIPTAALQGASISNAYLQLFIDDFQSPSMCSKFQLILNGKRFVEGEKLLNAIDQTGPVGKLVSIPLTEDLYPMLAKGNGLTLLIDESTGAADGFALDFVRLLINRKLENTCKGSVKGKVFEKDTENPIVGARVFTAENDAVITNSEGEFEMKNIPTGYEVLGASAEGYIDGAGTADIGQGDDNPELIIYLQKGKTASFNNKTIQVGESITLNNILFDQGKAELKKESLPELDKLLAFLRTNNTAEIELSGHTSSEGERGYNRSLSYRRVKACKDYLVGRGIGEERIIAIGFGPDKPIAPNDTEANRALNRRVEMRLKKL